VQPLGPPFPNSGALIGALAPQMPIVHAAGEGEPPRLIQIDEVVMYAIDLFSGTETREGSMSGYTKCEAVKWESVFKTSDCEGLVFTTQMREPFGPIMASAGD
jgi:hypothetical protein